MPIENDTQEPRPEEGVAAVEARVVTQKEVGGDPYMEALLEAAPAAIQMLTDAKRYRYRVGQRPEGAFDEPRSV